MRKFTHTHPLPSPLSAYLPIALIPAFLSVDPDTSSPVRSSELPGDTWRRGLQGGMGEEESKVMEAGQEGSDGTSSSDDGLFAKSSMYVLHDCLSTR